MRESWSHVAGGLLLCRARFLVRLHFKNTIFSSNNEIMGKTLNLHRHLRATDLSELASDTLSETLPKLMLNSK